jgi:hypothetical protein
LSIELLQTFLSLLEHDGDTLAAAKDLEINQPSMSKRLATLCVWSTLSGCGRIQPCLVHVPLARQVLVPGFRPAPETLAVFQPEPGRAGRERSPQRR